MFRLINSLPKSNINELNQEYQRELFKYKENRRGSSLEIYDNFFKTFVISFTIHHLALDITYQSSLEDFLILVFARKIGHPYTRQNA